MDTVARLVEDAAGGDQRAWDELVERFNGLLWAVARGHRLSDADAADVVQTAWLRLVERLGSLRDPERVGAWLATTTRNECLRTLRRSGRMVPTDDERRFDAREPTAPPDDDVILSERDAALWQAVDDLPERCRSLLRVLMADPPPSYEQVSAALDMPVGSIGPTRARCLQRLRRAVELDAGIDAGDRR